MLNFFGMRFSDNPRIELAYQFVELTDRHVFLTGKAGTGKTTFLKEFRKQTPKRLVVTAPTGVAAIQAGGVTLHSFFQLPFGPFIPGRPNQADPAAGNKKFSREKQRLIQSLDLLVIDEISMVRADMLDGVDEVLRRYRDPDTPFGGVQLLMIGDLHQLSPVIREEDWEMLRPWYDSVFFFSAHALREASLVSIELEHIYRQEDPEFISLLNEIRENQLQPGSLERLNRQFRPGFNPPEKDGYIILTTHNASAVSINSARLEALKQKPRRFDARVEGDFPALAYPTGLQLELRKDAQVMFVKNDPSREKLFFNGKIGQVTGFEDDTVWVKCPGDEDAIGVRPLKWDNVRYHLDENTREVSEEIIGSFIQIPLKLAWAITIHKSQGLTFDRAIIDAQAAFAAGQVYVALSRCRSLEGLVLRTPLPPRSIMTDSTIRGFTKQVQENLPTPNELDDSVRSFKRKILYDAFDLARFDRKWKLLLRTTAESRKSLVGSFPAEANNMNTSLEADLFEISRKFKAQLDYLLSKTGVHAESPEVHDRVEKACSYFSSRLEGFNKTFQNWGFETDNQEVKTRLSEQLDQVRKECFIRWKGIEALGTGFSTQKFLRARTDAELDYRPPRKALVHSDAHVPATCHNPELYQALRYWRDQLASESETDPYQILPQKSILDIANSLPQNLRDLKKIHGIGKARARMFGQDILETIQAYCRSKGLEVPSETPVEKLAFEEKPGKKSPAKGSSIMQTLEMFKAGMHIAEIARERSLVVSTIEDHLAKSIKLGLIEISQLLDPASIKEIREAIELVSGPGLSPIVNQLEGKYSFAQVRYVLNDALVHGKEEA